MTSQKSSSTLHLERGILDIETQLNALIIKRIQRLLNPNNAVWKNLMLYQFDFNSELFIVYIGVSTSPVKNTTPLFLTKLPLNLQTVQALFFRQYPTYILDFVKPPSNIGFFILHSILSFKSN